MKEILEKVVTGFFVITLGICWYCSTKYVVKPNQYTILVYDIFGKQSEIEGIRTKFKTKRIAISYLREYKDRFSFYDFSIREEIPEVKRVIFSKLRD